MFSKKEFCDYMIMKYINENNLPKDTNHNDLIQYVYSSTSLGLALRELGVINEKDYPNEFEYLQDRGGVLFVYVDVNEEDDKKFKYLTVKEMIDLLPADHTKEKRKRHVYVASEKPDKVDEEFEGGTYKTSTDIPCILIDSKTGTHVLLKQCEDNGTSIWCMPRTLIDPSYLGLIYDPTKEDHSDTDFIMSKLQKGVKASTVSSKDGNIYRFTHAMKDVYDVYYGVVSVSISI